MTKRKIRLTAGMIAVLILFIQLPVSAAVPGDPQSLYAKPHKAVFAVDEADEVSGTLEDTDAEEMPADLAEAGTEFIRYFDNTVALFRYLTYKYI